MNDDKIEHLVEYGECPAYPAPDAPWCPATTKRVRRVTDMHPGNGCDGWHWTCRCGEGGNSNATFGQAEAESRIHEYGPNPQKVSAPRTKS